MSCKLYFLRLGFCSDRITNMNYQPIAAKLLQNYAIINAALFIFNIEFLFRLFFLLWGCMRCLIREALYLMYNPLVHYIFPPTSLNFSTSSDIFSRTPCFLVRYSGFNGLILGRIEFSSMPLPLANLFLIEVAI